MEGFFSPICQQDYTKTTEKNLCLFRGLVSVRGCNLKQIKSAEVCALLSAILLSVCLYFAVTTCRCNIAFDSLSQWWPGLWSSVPFSHFHNGKWMNEWMKEWMISHFSHYGLLKLHCSFFLSLPFLLLLHPLISLSSSSSLHPLACRCIQTPSLCFSSGCCRFTSP